MYHLGKANVVADTLSRKSTGILTYITPSKRLLIEEIHKLETKGVQFELSKSRVLLACRRARSSLTKKIREAQCKDPRLKKLMEDV